MSAPVPFDLGRERQCRILCDAPAKINLALHVTGLRDDGYHSLESLVVFCDIADRIDVGYRKLTSPGMAAVHSIGPFAQGMPPGKENLAFQAAHALESTIKKLINGIDITIEKNLPIASGMGGGWADAAAALIAIARLLNEPNDSNLVRIAEAIGSDVPMCLYSEPLIARGRGENIEILKDFPALDLVLINPRVSVSTPEVFSNLTSKSNSPLAPLPSTLTFDSMINWLADQRNDLQASAEILAPVIRASLRALEASGALLARMSGSGATCFGIYNSRAKAENAARKISKDHPDWWVVSTRTKVHGKDRAREISATLPFGGDSIWINSIE